VLEITLNCCRTGGVVDYRSAQQPTSPSPKPTSPGKIAKASLALTQKNESCRLQANEEKLTGFKRHRFIRDCVKK
jgi:hypothetical protein